MDVREKLIELLEPHMSGLACEYESGSCELTSCRSCNARNIADHLIANGVTVQEWIPVTERLPENIANRVLVVCERSNGVFYAHYEKPFWINLETDKPFISTVTHWMPLPSTEGLK